MPKRALWSHLLKAMLANGTAQRSAELMEGAYAERTTA